MCLRSTYCSRQNSGTWHIALHVVSCRITLLSFVENKSSRKVYHFCRRETTWNRPEHLVAERLGGMLHWTFALMNLCLIWRTVLVIMAVKTRARLQREYNILIAENCWLLKTWVYLRLCLARPCVHLRWLAMTYAHFGRDQMCTQVKANFSPFGHPTQVIASWVASINVLLANEIQDMSALRCLFFATYEYLGGNLRVRLATQRKSLRKFNLHPLNNNNNNNMIYIALYTKVLKRFTMEEETRIIKLT